METNIIQLIETASWAGVAMLVVWKVLAPLMGVFTRKVNGKDGNGLDKRLKSIETNHLTEIRNDINELKGDVRRLREEQTDMRERLATLEAKAFNHGK